MKREEIKAKVLEILKNQFALREDRGNFIYGRDRYVSETTEFSKDLLSDSLDAVEIMMETEDAFRLTILDEQMEDVMSVGDLINFVKGEIEAGKQWKEKEK